jgi:uncharacterized protein (DUF2267 family)
MSTRRHSPFDHAVHKANAWLVAVATSLGTDDRHFAYRALRAWLHTLRDRLSIDGAVHFGAQLPELLRGLYYDGWVPSRVPVKYGKDEYLYRFVQEARIPLEEVAAVAAAVTAVLRDHLSPGQLDGALAQLPSGLRSLIVGVGRDASAATQERQVLPASQARNGHSVDQRLDTLEAQVASVTEALRVLAHGLETTPGAVPDEQRGPRAARQAYEILLSQPSKQSPA